MMPMAVPGLVLGLGYVFFVNAPWNPLGVLYGTLAVLAVNYDRAFLYDGAHHGGDGAEADRSGVRGGVGVAAGAVLPDVRAGDAADLPAGDPGHRGLYVRQRDDDGVGGDFPVRRGTKLASISIVHMDESGATAAAAAMAAMIVLTAMGVKTLHLVIDRLLLQRLQAWRKR